jgi:hypothetical protein
MSTFLELPDMNKDLSNISPRVVGYLRVRTGAQDLENQQLGIFHLQTVMAGKSI